MQTKKQSIICTFLIAIIWFAFLPGNAGMASDAPTGNVVIPSEKVAEARDFATTKFGDAWDMDDISDVSQHLNGGGRVVSLKYPSVVNGIFSALTKTTYLKTGPAMFNPLFQGYSTGINVTKNIGSIHPIDPYEFACIYIAMKVKSPQYVPNSGKLPDHLLVGWDAGNDSTSAAKPRGNTYLYLYPESIPSSPVVHNWKLYKINLADPPNGYYSSSTKWLDHPSWDGLRVHPSIFKDIKFKIDWIRLTSCQDNPSHQVEISWAPDSSVSAVWARPNGVKRAIQLETGINGNSGYHMLDTKGLPPGRYEIGLGSTTQCCSQWSGSYLTINSAPIATFNRPSSTKGEDFANSKGNPWDIYENDVKKIQCTDESFSNGKLGLKTAYPKALQPKCRPNGEADTQIKLNMPGSLYNAGDYRYLVFKHKIKGKFSLPADGMIGYLVWQTTDNCQYVGRPIVYDVGWREYIVDMHESWNGTPIQSAPQSCGLKKWGSSGKIKSIRFDPNENWTGHEVPKKTFKQKIDWIMLTKQEKIVSGQTYQIEINLNKSVSFITSSNFFYTTNPSNPTQNQALQNLSAPDTPVSTDDPFTLSALDNTSSSFSLTYQWDTSNVAPGEYYVCVELQDGSNTSYNCSESTVIVK